MTFSREPYQIAISSVDTIPASERAYYRQRFLHNVFEKIMLKFVQRAENNELTKKRLAVLLGKDAGQINRTLSLPSNMTLEMLSDLSLALGCEPEIFLAEFDEAVRHNYIHPSMMKYLNDIETKKDSSNKKNIIEINKLNPSSSVNKQNIKLNKPPSFQAA